MTLSLSQMNQIRAILNLTHAPYDEIPDNLLYLSFIPKGTKIDPSRFEEYNLRDNDLLEFLGDAILDVIVAQYLSLFNLDNYSCFLRHIVSNVVLTCLMEQKKLCDPFFRVQAKACADRLEAIVGMIYYYFGELNLNNDSLQIVANWFYSTFDMNRLINEINQRGRTNCPQDQLSPCRIQRAIPIVINMTINIPLTSYLTAQARAIKNVLKLVPTDPSIEKDPDDLETDMLADIPLDLILLAFIYQGYKLNINSKLYLQKYGFSSNRMFIFFGQKLFEMLISEDLFHLIYLNRLKTAQEAHLIREELIADSSLLQVLETKNLAAYSFTNTASPDLIYSIIGMIYYYLYNVLRNPFAFDILKIWFLQFWPPELRANRSVLFT